MCISNWLPLPHHQPLLDKSLSGTDSSGERQASRIVFTTCSQLRGGVRDFGFRVRKQLRGGDGGCREVVVLASGLGAVQVRLFDTEATMIRAWESFVVHEVDPDVICGFDLAGYVTEPRHTAVLQPLTRDSATLQAHLAPLAGSMHCAWAWLHASQSTLAVCW